VPQSLPACSYVPLPCFKGFNLVALFLVRGQSEARHLNFLSQDLAGVESLATLGASVDPVAIRNLVLLITPIVPISYIASHGSLFCLVSPFFIC